MTTLNRCPGWPAALQGEFEKAARRRFRFGSHDCFRFAASCFRVLTGASIAAAYAHVKNRAAVAAVIAEHGGLGAPFAALMENNGCPEVAALKAGRGDLVLVEFEGEESIGVVSLDGRAVYYPRRPRGLAEAPLDRDFVKRAWRVG